MVVFLIEHFKISGLARGPPGSIGGAHQGLGGLSPPNVSPHLWMCIESKLLKGFKRE